MKRVFLLGAVVVCAAVTVLWPRQVSSHETLTTTVLFDREIVRILNSHCVMCHVEHGPSFPLETYEETFLRGRKIRAEVIAKHMPPWAAVSGYGQFVNENVPTLRETQFLVSWVEGLGPRNAGSVFLNVLDPGLPRPKIVRAESSVGQWRLGPPALKRELPVTIVDPQRGDFVTRSVVDLGLTSEQRVRALEFMPGDRRVVRAAFFTLQETGQWLGSWTPWYGFVNLPAGTAYRLPAGAHVVAEMHYRSVKEPVADRGTLGLYFAESHPRIGRRNLVLDAVAQAPTGTAPGRFRADVRLSADTRALALRPAVHSGLQSIEVAARKPDGGTEVLLFAQNIPIDWPTPYIFKTPMLLPKGSVLSMTAYADPSGVAQTRGIRLTVSKT